MLSRFLQRSLPEWINQRGRLGAQVQMPTKSWQIIGEYNDTGFAAQSSNASSLQVVTRKRDIPNIDLEALASLEQSFFIGGSSGGLDTSIGNVVNIRHRMMAGLALLAMSAAPVAVPANEGAYPVLEYFGAIPAGTTIYLDKEANVPTAGLNTGPQTIIYSTQGASSAVGRKSGATVTFDATGLSSGTGTLMCPITIGYGVHLYPTFCGVGDSIISSNGDPILGDGGPVGVEGRLGEGGAWFRRSRYLAQVLAGRSVPLRLLGRPSAEMQAMRANGGVGAAKRRESYRYCNTLVITMGANDLGNGRTAAQLKADIEAEIVVYRAMWAAANPLLPCYVIVCTITPRGSTAYNVPVGFAAQIVQHNYNVRHGLIAGSDGYLDPNIAVSDPADETIWASASYCGVSDFLHPVAAGYALIAMETSPYLARNSSPWRTFL